MKQALVAVSETGKAVIGKNSRFNRRDIAAVGTRALIDYEHEVDMNSSTTHILSETLSQLREANSRLASQEARLRLLERLVYLDDLTGLMNRRGFKDAVIRECDRTRRNISRGGLIVMIDLDNFKAINDTYGHDAGDCCLTSVGTILMSEIRQMDVAARLGGDEFALLFADAEKHEALSRIQDLAWKLNHSFVPYNGAVLPVRASVGVREFGPHDDIEDILRSADASMYAQKTSKERNLAATAINMA